MGELHLEILVDRLKREFKVECNQGAPQVAYKEAITAFSEFREVFKKQTGGRGKFADIIFGMPSDDGQRGLQFINEVKGGRIPKEYIPSVEKGFREAMVNGPMAGFPLDSFKVILKDGSYHPVDSDALAFEIAAKQAFRKYAGKCNPVILEPIMSTEVVTPEEYVGDVIGDFNRRRGRWKVWNRKQDQGSSRQKYLWQKNSVMLQYLVPLPQEEQHRRWSSPIMKRYLQKYQTEL
jgi:elongation factor G